MKIKNVKVGTRVQLKRDVVTNLVTLNAGITGTLRDSNTNIPVVAWDVPVKYSYAYKGVGNSWAVCAADLRKIKE